MRQGQTHFRTDLLLSVPEASMRADESSTSTDDDGGPVSPNNNEHLEVDGYFRRASYGASGWLQNGVRRRSLRATQDDAPHGGIADEFRLQEPEQEETE